MNFGEKKQQEILVVFLLLDIFSGDIIIKFSKSYS